MAEWQPIETAPVNCNRILCYAPGNPNAVSPAARKSAMRVDNRYYSRGTGVIADHYYREYPEAKYTHWMPLPEPPEK